MLNQIKTYFKNKDISMTNKIIAVIPFILLVISLGIGGINTTQLFQIKDFQETTQTPLPLSDESLITTTYYQQQKYKSIGTITGDKVSNSVMVFTVKNPTKHYSLFEASKTLTINSSIYLSHDIEHTKPYSDNDIQVKTSDIFKYRNLGGVAKKSISGIKIQEYKGLHHYNAIILFLNGSNIPGLIIYYLVVIAANILVWIKWIKPKETTK